MHAKLMSSISDFIYIYVNFVIMETFLPVGEPAGSQAGGRAEVVGLPRLPLGQATGAFV